MFCAIRFWVFRNLPGHRYIQQGEKASILRQGITDKGRFWGDGLRAPIGNRVAYAGAALAWGTILGGAQCEDTLLLQYCGPYTMDAYEASAPDAKKLEARAKLPVTLDRFQRCAKQHNILFCLIYGEQRRKERLDALETMVSLGETQPELPHVDFLCQCLGSYVLPICGGD